MKIIHFLTQVVSTILKLHFYLANALLLHQCAAEIYKDILIPHKETKKNFTDEVWNSIVIFFA
jgi:hypothetical protein